jgi:hypothetical protein
MNGSRWPCLLLAALAAAGACRARSSDAPARGSARDAASAAPLDAQPPVDAAASMSGTPDAPVPPAPAAPEPAPDLVPAGSAPWLSFANGQVAASDRDGTRALAEGDPILPGTMLAVAPLAQAQLDLPDGSTIDLDELTELLVRDVEVRDGLRRIELTVYDGAVRAIVPATPESGSSFRVATPVGVVELQSGDVSVEVDGGNGTTRVLVLGGSAVVQAGAGQLTVTGAGSAPGAAEIASSTGVRTVESTPQEQARWLNWDDRAGDRLIDLYAVDIGTPQDVAAAPLSADVHPGWASQIRVRRGLIERRASDLAAALGPEALAGAVDLHVLHSAGRDAWGQATGNRHLELAEADRPARVERWNARAAARAERLAAMAGTLADLRRAYLDPSGTKAQ